VYLLFTPFITQRAMRGKTGQIVAKKYNPDFVVLISASGASAVVATLALLFQMLTDRSVGHVYGWALVSFIMTGFWCCRFRKLLS
jgi:hypothetical protein